MSADRHGPQRAADFFSLLMQFAVGQRRPPRTQDRRCVGNALGLILEQVRQAGERKERPLIWCTPSGHVIQSVSDQLKKVRVAKEPPSIVPLTRQKAIAA